MSCDTRLGMATFLFNAGINHPLRTPMTTTKTTKTTAAAKTKQSFVFDDDLLVIFQLYPSSFFFVSSTNLWFLLLRCPHGLWRWRCCGLCLYVFDINQLSLPAAFYSFLVSVSVFMAPSTVFHFINSPDHSPLSHSVLPVLFLPNWSFQLYVSLYESLPQP